MKLNVSPDRLGKVLVPAAWGWVLLVAVLTFWGIWDNPARVPDINEVATTHLFLFPVSMALFFLLSWLRQYYDDEPSHPDPRPFVRWRATLGIWTLALLHPVSCALYPAVFNLDDRTVDEISRAVRAHEEGQDSGPLRACIPRGRDPLSVQPPAYHGARTLHSPPESPGTA